VLCPLLERLYKRKLVRNHHHFLQNFEASGRVFQSSPQLFKTLKFSQILRLFLK
jgi:hypothetical protein